MASAIRFVSRLRLDCLPWSSSKRWRQGKLKAIWILCTNPAASAPDLDLIEKALRQAELVIVQDAYHPTATSRLAHVILPAAQWSEKEGVMTNSERRVTYMPKLVDPPGEALPDWQIIARFAAALGFGADFAYASSQEIFAEFAALTKTYAAAIARA